MPETMNHTIVSQKGRQDVAWAVDTPRKRCIVRLASSLNVTNYATLVERGQAAWAVEAWQAGLMDLIRSTRSRIVMLYVEVDVGWQLAWQGPSRAAVRSSVLRPSLRWMGQWLVFTRGLWSISWRLHTSWDLQHSCRSSGCHPRPQQPRAELPWCCNPSSNWRGLLSAAFDMHTRYNGTWVVQQSWAPPDGCRGLMGP